MAASGFVAPQGFGVQPVPGVAAPSASLYGIPGLSLSTPSAFPGTLGAGDAAFAAQLGAGAVKRHAGFPSQEIVSQPHVVRPWKDGLMYHERIGRGQLLFVRRGTSADQMSTIVTLPQMNAVMLRAYTVALTAGVLERAGGRRGGGGGGILDADLLDDTRQAVEQVLEDDLDYRRRMLDTAVADGAKAENATERLLNTNSRSHTTNPELRSIVFDDERTSYLAYLSLGGITGLWNYLGVSRNIEFKDTRFKMLNAIQSGPYEVDNVWGSGLQQGAYVYVVLRRHRNEATGEYEQFEYVPWAQRFDASVARVANVYSKYPSLDERRYEDVAGYEQCGVAYEVGKVGRMPAAPGRRLGGGGAGTASALASSMDARALLLAGLARNTHDAEMAAWNETQRNNKQTVWLAIGHDAHHTGIVA